ncbi:hypothetical protein [Holdemanella biformis]|uniref:hypothetical protein n=1 Tax=Holdemanella biformis TaxID=1735 RepID=UPI0026721D3E|nr:hypothetical protein [Holdemanella biformis]MEE0473770.1 hypothetical protein [Holdemanella biformis]
MNNIAYEEILKDLTPFQQATILYNDVHICEEYKRYMLLDVLKMADGALKNQIEERLKFMLLKSEDFEQDKDGFVFVVRDCNHKILSMFLKYADANDFVCQYRYEKGINLNIAKYCMSNIYKCTYWSPSITTEQEVKGNCVVGKEIFDHGIMNDCFREGDYFQNKTRFEYGFFHIPNRFNRGDIVRYTYDENYYMVLMSQEEYQNLFGYEIQASYLRTCYLDIDGLWKIKYLNPLFLKSQNFKNMGKSEMYKESYQLLRDYLISDAPWQREDTMNVLESSRMYMMENEKYLKQNLERIKNNKLKVLNAHSIEDLFRLDENYEME